MKVIIVGIGMTGSALALRLLNEKHDVTVVDEDFDTVDALVTRSDVKGVVGSCLDRNILADAEVGKADCFFACTLRDELNILSSVLAKKMGAKHTVARVRDPKYFNSLAGLKDELGVDMMFNPEYRTAMEIAQILKFPSAISADTFASGKMTLTELRINENSPIAGLPVAEAARKADGNLLFAVVIRGDKSYIPKGDFVLQAGDLIYVASTEESLLESSKKIKLFKQRAKDVIIVGGGRITYYLAKELLDKGVKVKIIEIDEDRCRELDEELTRATVICADGTDTSVLDEEGIREADAFIALTTVDEENAVVALYASSFGDKKVIAKILSRPLGKMVNKLGLDTVISPHEVISDLLVRFVRAHQVEDGEGINALYRIHDKAEAIEFTVDGDFKGLGIPLKELKLKNNVLLCGLVRDGGFILPSGDTSLCEHDKVLVVTGVKQVTELNQILK
ncbi:MAG: Trk system potassium transporter TrkA [Clostridia bacterium]|nr:Trk system potassium transporter TrkA [Clostridia bacterium]